MAKRKTRAARKKVVKTQQSVLSKGQLYLNQHDEEKVLLFVTGILFGVGLSVTMLEGFLFGGIVALVVTLVLLFIEKNQRFHF